ncbi:hypothetical protein [Aeromonas phage T7-Ah]|uniref:Uncharacterized protein n=1 Tax=Aeromonas phage T7-Ah TaxID=2759196 RepID=A0A7S6L110_9CAUD|nr:hypothetical protein [Aeromonas phage T7-Ah]
MKNMLKRLHDALYKDMVYSVSLDRWFYREGATGEWVE